MSESSVLIAQLRQVAGMRPVCEVDSRSEDAWLGEGLAKARLHEVYAAEGDDAAAGAGFALALALASGAVPLLWLRTEAAERQAGRLHAAGLAELGMDADAVVLGIVADEAALLRAAADAARCAGLGTLLVEAWGRAPGIDLTATRRLQLAAEASGVTALLLRIGAEPVPSAAATRWGVSGSLSQALPANAPGDPAFEVTLLRRRGGPAGQSWRVEWKRETRTFIPAEALSGAGLPLAADRAAEERSPAPLRRTG